MKKRSVCIVDDDKIFRFTTVKYFEFVSEVSRAFSFTKAVEALEYLKENRDSPENLPDILMVDLNMPVMDGWEFVKEIENLQKKLSKKIYVFVVSSSIDESDREQALQHPAITDYLIKPLNEDRLNELVQKTL